MRNSNPTLDIGKTGIILAAVPWNRITSSLSVDYQYDEKTATAVSYGYGRDYYANPMYVDDISHDVNAGFVSDLGEYFPSVKAKMNAGYSKYSFPGSRIDNVIGDVGFSWGFNETVSVLVDGGIRRTWSEMSAARLKSGGWGWVGKVSLNYNGERGNGELVYTRDVAPAYGFNGAAESDALTLSVQNMFTNELSSFFTAGYNALKSVSKFSTKAINKHIFRVNPGVRYEFSKDMAAEASYEYTMVDYRELVTEANRHIFSLRLYIQHSFLE
ncbi:MAG: hypothetical protein HY887_01070 [Deltaproteobacteria bacterium]|nr:hypothetical protein [Deltaproteobacteria bacterium]